MIWSLRGGVRRPAPNTVLSLRRVARILLILQKLALAFQDFRVIRGLEGMCAKGGTSMYSIVLMAALTQGSIAPDLPPEEALASKSQNLLKASTELNRGRRRHCCGCCGGGGYGYYGGLGGGYSTQDGSGNLTYYGNTGMYYDSNTGYYVPNGVQGYYDQNGRWIDRRDENRGGTETERGREGNRDRQDQNRQPGERSTMPSSTTPSNPSTTPSSPRAPSSPANPVTPPAPSTPPAPGK